MENKDLSILHNKVNIMAGDDMMSGAEASVALILTKLAKIIWASQSERSFFLLHVSSQ